MNKFIEMEASSSDADENETNMVNAKDAYYKPDEL
jgi:hypothetical protein